MSEKSINLKSKIKNNTLTLGSWITLYHPAIAEIMSKSGFDWLAIDLEHSVISIREAEELIRVISLSGVTPLIRLTSNDRNQIKRVMDAGSHGVIVPMVNTAEEAKKAVEACYYPPKGVRGVAMSQRGNDYTRDKNYFKNIEENICLIPQLETVKSIDNISGIANTDGVTALFIGPADLSADMGILGEFDNKELWKMIEKAVVEIKKNNKSVGTLIGRKDLVKRSIDIGFDFVACGTDSNLLAKGSDDLLAVFKN